jgi:hypothetical protein
VKDATGSGAVRFVYLEFNRYQSYY